MSQLNLPQWDTTMKSRRNEMKIISSFVLLTLIFNTPAFAQQGLFLNYSTSQKLLKDVVECRNDQRLLTNCNSTVENQETEISKLKTLVFNYEKDKLDIINTSEQYKKLSKDTNEKLVECKQSTPSRATWFGAGLLSALILSLASAFVLK